MVDKEHERQIYDQKFDTIICDSPEQFIEILRPSNSIWQTKINGQPEIDEEWYRNWYFRGQVDSSWSLVPTAWRLNGKVSELLIASRKFLRRVDGAYHEVITQFGTQGDMQLSRRITEATKHITSELMLVRDFLDFADSLGFHTPTSNIPPINPDFIRNVVRQLLDQDYSQLEILWNDPAIALAQHHGIPTRLLDWTKNPMYAAFFAAHDVVFPQNNVEAKPANMAIYAMHTLFLNNTYSDGRRVIDFVNKLSENAYLRAQEGQFTLDTNADKFFIENGEYPDLMTSLFSLGSSLNKDIKPKKIVISTEFAPEILRLLFLERVTKANLMPTLDNAANTIMNKWSIVLGESKNG